MAMYEVAGKIVDLSALNQKEINALLSPLVGRPGMLHCLCQSKKQAMHVSRRGSNYFPVKEAGSGKLHARLCRHHTLTVTEVASIGYTLDALKSADDEMVVTLSKPLKKSKESVTAVSSIFRFENGQSRPVTNRMTELGLLHLLWESANLNRFRPGGDQKSIWPRLRQAACGIRPAGFRNLAQGLSDLLLLPLHSETENQLSRNFAKFKEAQSGKRYLIFMARLNPDELDALLSAEAKDASLKELFGVNLTLYSNCAKPILDGVRRSFGAEIGYSQQHGDDLIILGIAQPDEQKNYAKISSFVLMPVVSGNIPYDSGYEREFVIELVRQGRLFKKPLKYEATKDLQMHPDFALLDTKPPVVIEIYGMDTPEYLARKAEKRQAYQNGRFAYWEWDVLRCHSLASWLKQRPLPRAAG